MASLTWFWFCFLCTYFGYTFFFQKMVLINLNAIFPKKIFCNFSYKPKSGNCVYIWTVIICIFHLLRNKANCNHKPTFFLGITTRLLLSLVLLCGSRFLKKKKKKKKKKISGLKSLYLFQSRHNNGVKIWAFDATRGISR